jgi:hypothetical protein
MRNISHSWEERLNSSRIVRARVHGSYLVQLVPWDLDPAEAFSRDSLIRSPILSQIFDLTFSFPIFAWDVVPKLIQPLFETIGSQNYPST